MPAASFTPVRSTTTAAAWANRRLRPRRTRREAIWDWWRRARVALGIERPRRRLADPPVPALAAAAGVGADGVLLLAFRLRASRLKVPELLTVLTASGRTWRHRLALKSSRYYRREPVAASHSSISATDLRAEP